MKKEEKLIGNEPLETGDKTADAGQESSQPRLSWEQILADAQYRACYDKAVQEIVQRRLRNSKAAEQRLNELQPLLEALCARYGGRPETVDAAALAAMVLEGLEKQRQDDEKILRHLEALLGQEAELKESVPEFELLAALEDPGFLKLTAPHTGLSLADAYYALNRQEIGRAAAKEGLEALSRSIRSGGARPRELSDRREGAGFSPDPRSMTKAEREALKKRIYAAGANRQKIYP